MLLLHSLQPGSFRRHCARNVFAFVVVSFLFTALLFTGCKQEPDDVYIDDHIINIDLYGTWTDPAYFDGYTITETSLSYNYNWSGNIRYVYNFNPAKTAGVIIVEYEEGQEATYNTWGQEEDGEWIIVGTKERPGNFLGIYYRNLIPGVSVEMSSAIDVATYDPVEEATLWKAIKAFTEGNTGKYIGMWGGPYEKK